MNTQVSFKSSAVALLTCITLLCATGSVSAAASADGRVYTVSATSGANIRSCAGTSCSILTTINFGADVLNDGSGGSVIANGITWVRVVYRFSSTDLCTNGTQSKGWIDANLLSGGSPRVIASAGAAIRSGPSCSNSSYGTVANGTTLGFYQGDNQWSQKWYEIARPGAPIGSSAWVQGWQLTDVR